MVGGARGSVRATGAGSVDTTLVGGSVTAASAAGGGAVTAGGATEITDLRIRELDNRVAPPVLPHQRGDGRARGLLLEDVVENRQLDELALGSLLERRAELPEAKPQQDLGARSLGARPDRVGVLAIEHRRLLGRLFFTLLDDLEIRLARGLDAALGHVDGRPRRLRGRPQRGHRLRRRRGRASADGRHFVRRDGRRRLRRWIGARRVGLRRQRGHRIGLGRRREGIALCGAGDAMGSVEAATSSVDPITGSLGTVGVGNEPGAAAAPGPGGGGCEREASGGALLTR